MIQHLVAGGGLTPSVHVFGTWIKEFCYQNEERMTVNGVSHNTFNFF